MPDGRGQIAEGRQSPAQIEAEIDGLANRFRSLGEVAGRLQRLLEQGQGLRAGRPGHGPGPRAPQIGHRLLPLAALKGVVSQPVDLNILGQGLDGLGHSRVEGAPALVEQGAVRHFVGQRVLERELPFGKWTRVVQETGGLEAAECPHQLLGLLLGDGLQQAHRHVLSDDGRGLQHALVPR